MGNGRSYVCCISIARYHGALVKGGLGSALAHCVGCTLQTFSSQQAASKGKKCCAALSPAAISASLLERKSTCTTLTLTCLQRKHTNTRTSSTGMSPSPTLSTLLLTLTPPFGTRQLTRHDECLVTASKADVWLKLGYLLKHRSITEGAARSALLAALNPAAPSFRFKAYTGEGWCKCHRLPVSLTI